MVWGVNNKIVSPGKSGEVFPACGMNTSCDAKVTFGNPICCINLPGKTSTISYFGNYNDVCNRTAIRHR